MEKVIWVLSSIQGIGTKKDDGLHEVNDLLQQGWTIKMLSAAPLGTAPCGQAYFVLEKKD